MTCYFTIGWKSLFYPFSNGRVEFGINFFKDQKISWMFHFLKLKIRPTVPELSAIKKWELIKQHWKNLIFRFLNLCMAISQQLRVVSTKFKKAKYREFFSAFRKCFFQRWANMGIAFKNWKTATIFKKVT